MKYLGTLKGKYKHLLLVASARAIRVTYHYPDTILSFLQLHHIANRATPKMFRKFKQALQLYHTFNEIIPLNDWLSRIFYHANKSGQTTFNIRKSNLHVVGMNVLNNRFRKLNNKLPLDWFNLTINLFKLSCKKLFLTFAN